MRGAALVLATLMVVGGFGLGGALPARGDDGWRAKADAFLLDAYDAGQPSLTVQLTGPPIPAPAARPADRAAWNAHWAAAAEPFLGGLRRAVDGAGGEVTTVFPAVNSAFVRLPHDAVPALVGRGDVRRAGLDWVGAIRIQDGPAPADPGVQVTLGQAASLIQVPDLWTLGYRGEGVVVAVTDTGVRSTHEMMKNADGTTRVALWRDFSGTSGCTTPCDGNGHGTHTTTTAVGSNLFNSGSPQGMAPRAVAWHAKVLDNGGSGSWEWGQQGLQWAFDNGADLTSNSWGGGCGGAATTTGELAEQLAEAGMVSVFSAGNSGPGAGTVGCPGHADKVITVGAVDVNQNVAGFSSRGPCTWRGIERVCPDVMGMGVSLVAGWVNSDTSYASASGTSMSTPTVAGLLALLQQASRDLRGRDLEAPMREGEALLRWTAKDLGAAGIDNDYGWGLAQGKAARDALLAPALDLRALSTFPSGDLHALDARTVTFGVANLGTPVASGQFRLEVRQTSFGACPPACDLTVVADQAVDLGNAQEVQASYRFSGFDHPPGTYRATGTFTYTYTDPADGLLKSGTVTRTGDFVLKKVVWQAQQVMPATARSGDLVPFALVLANVGNEEARDVQVKEDFNLAGVAPVPQVPPGAGPTGILADPGPQTAESPQNGVVRYVWDVGTIAPGTGWDVDMDFLAGQPGTWLFRARVVYDDESGAQFVLNVNRSLVIAGPV